MKEFERTHVNLNYKMFYVWPNMWMRVKCSTYDPVSGGEALTSWPSVWTEGKRSTYDPVSGGLIGFKHLYHDLVCEAWLKCSTYDPISGD
jgi:hypothetical protein